MHQLPEAYDRTPQRFDVDDTMWGSDFPRTEGMRDPLACSQELESLLLDTRKAVRGGNLDKLLADA